MAEVFQKKYCVTCDGEEYEHGHGATGKILLFGRKNSIVTHLISTIGDEPVWNPLATNVQRCNTSYPNIYCPCGMYEIRWSE